MQIYNVYQSGKRLYFIDEIEITTFTDDGNGNVVII